MQVFLLCSCSKIDLPNPETEKVIGEWRYVGSSGGLSGGMSDSRFNSESRVEYRKNGKYKVYDKDGKTDKDHFYFRKIEGEYLIDYENKIDQTFKVSNDTLCLIDQGNDLYSYIFVKK